MNALGEPIPAEAFENDIPARPVPLKGDDLAKFDAETERLRKLVKQAQAKKK